MTLHFISGLPRSGSTLLSALLRQNPSIHASIQSPLADVVRQTIQIMSNAETSFYLSDAQRHRMLGALMSEYYSHMTNRTIVFDSHRYWCALLPLVAALSPESRVICCVRNPAWILDSFERLVQGNPLRTSKVFNNEIGTVFSRAEFLFTKHLVGTSIQAVRQAWFGEHSGRLIALRYDSLVENPAGALERLYSFLGEPLFGHDFANVQYDEPDFDDRLGLPGMHRVSGPVMSAKRRTILPPELFAKYSNDFWDDPAANPKGVPII